MKRYSLPMSLFLSASVFAAQPTHTIAGNYVCSGTEVGTQEAFKCTMTIKKTGETYASTAQCNDGTAYLGVGIYDAKTRHLSTGFINPKNPKETGVAVDKINADGSYEAQWAYLNTQTIGRAKCFKQKA